MKNLKSDFSTDFEQEIHPLPTAPTVDENDNSDNMNNNSNDSNSDEEAAREASRHRDHAQNMVRDHLENHAAHNPGNSSDYVTWIATLHPENADIAIDQRFFVPGNPWWTIYEDTKNNNNPTLFATAVPIDVEEGTAVVATASTPTSASTTVGGADDTSRASSSGDIAAADLSRKESKSNRPHCCLTCNPIAILAGFLVAIPAFVTVLTCELVALVFFYLPSTVFYKCGQAFAPPNICSFLLYSVFMVAYTAFSLGDSIMLLASVLAAELVGGFALFVGFVTGGCLWAKFLSQYIRRMCHGVRVVFRKDGASKDNKHPSRGLWCGTTNAAAHERERKARRDRGVKVINVQRVRRPGESYH